ncbi:histone H1-like [Impatiens glandulifera]|uniref:histone H1-like n=1 Tax=Impatiens glandulifera TaxID=253017 RepID=UPI001FB176CF|nr:histone H1-like [Impatiens glandulifera]
MATQTSSAVKAKKIKNPPTHPRYIEMVTEAIVTLKERNGSSQYAIAKHIEDKQKQLPSNFKKLLLVQLKKLVASGKLVKVKSSFKIPAAAARSKVSKTVIPPTKNSVKPVEKKNKLPVKTKAATTKPAAKPTPKSKVTVAKSEAKPKAASKAKPAAKPKAAAAAKPKAAAAKPKAAAAKPKAAAAKPKEAIKKAKVVTAMTSTRTSPAASPALKPAPKKAPVKPKTVKSSEKKRVTRSRKN